MEVIEKAPAKLNLSIDLSHESIEEDYQWDMVMTAIDLADYVTVSLLEKSTQISISTDNGFLPNDHRNLAYQAVLVMQSLVDQPTGVKISIKKKIPVAAGLGGGSADAAAVIRALNQLWKLNLTLETMATIGLQIDDDVPFCIYNQLAHVSGFGDQIKPLSKLPSSWLVVAKPKASVSTPSIIRQIKHHSLEHIRTQALIDGIEAGNQQQIIDNMGNILEPITTRRIPEIRMIKQQMMRFGADTAQMSGTGPSVFGICFKQSRAQHVYNSIKGFCQEVYLVRPL